jgi:hypothetical protein
MSRLEHFQQLIEQAKSEADKLRLAKLPAADWWEEIREKTIRPVLVDAETALKRSGFFAEQITKNGGSGIMLQASSGDASPRHDITFTLSAEVILVSSTERNLSENWDVRGYVTQENVTRKVDKFLEVFINPAGSVSRYETPGEGVFSVAL